MIEWGFFFFYFSILLLFTVIPYLLCRLVVLAFQKTDSSQLMGRKAIFVTFIAFVGFYLTGLVSTVVVVVDAPLIRPDCPFILFLLFFLLYFTVEIVSLKLVSKLSLIKLGLLIASCFVLQFLYIIGTGKFLAWKFAYGNPIG